MKSAKKNLTLTVAVILTAAWCGHLVAEDAEDDEFAAFEEMEKQAFAAFEKMEAGARRAWEHREQELARTWEEERTALLKAFGEVEKEAQTDPLKTVSTDVQGNAQLSQSQIDFAAGKVKVEVVVVASSAEKARQQAEKLAREKIQQTALQVPVGGDRTLQDQAQDAQAAEKQQAALGKTYDETKKVSATLPDGQVEARVSLEQPLTGANGLTAMALAAAEQEPEEEPAPAPPRSARQIVRDQGPFTGLLLDASAVPKAKPSLVPTVRAADGSLIYGPAKVKKEKAIHGMADWLRAADAAKGAKRLGDKPLRVQVTEVQRGGRMIVSDADADLIRAADSGFLSDCQVAVLLGK